MGIDCYHFRQSEHSAYRQFSIRCGHKRSSFLEPFLRRACRILPLVHLSLVSATTQTATVENAGTLVEFGAVYYGSQSVNVTLDLATALTDTPSNISLLPGQDGPPPYDCGPGSQIGFGRFCANVSERGCSGFKERSCSRAGIAGNGLGRRLRAGAAG